MLNYNLTDAQEKASTSILNFVKKGEDVLVNAVCGAGKTELVYKSIEYCISCGKKVAFAIPRKDVVKEIYARICKDFKNISVTEVYGGNNSKLEAQIVILTTHQLYRYPNYFDLLILDEADAFPYYKNDLLETFLKKSTKGPIIYMSATLDSSNMKTKNVVIVNKRFHSKPIPIPSVVMVNRLNEIKIIKDLILKYQKRLCPLLIFVPTIDEGKMLSKKINVPFIYSSSIDRQKMISNFKKGKISVLITTSILERGITFFNVQVLVYNASSPLFTLSSLIQISGRVGRKLKAPTGDIIFITHKMTDTIKECINLLKSKNQTIV